MIHYLILFAKKILMISTLWEPGDKQVFDLHLLSTLFKYFIKIEGYLFGKGSPMKFTSEEKHYLCSEPGVMSCCLAQTTRSRFIAYASSPSA